MEPLIEKIPNHHYTDELTAVIHALGCIADRRAIYPLIGIASVLPFQRSVDENMEYVNAAHTAVDQIMSSLSPRRAAEYFINCLDQEGMVAEEYRVGGKYYIDGVLTSVDDRVKAYATRKVKEFLRSCLDSEDPDDRAYAEQKLRAIEASRHPQSISSKLFAFFRRGRKET